MECPKCHSEHVNQTPVAGMLRCICGEYFRPEPAKPILPELTEEERIARAMAVAAGRISLRVESIRGTAENFKTGAILLALTGALVLFGTVISFIDADFHSAITCLAIGISLLSLATWCFLIAQVIHIRANTER